MKVLEILFLNLFRAPDDGLQLRWMELPPGQYLAKACPKVGQALNELPGGKE